MASKASNTKPEKKLTPMMAQYQSIKKTLAEDVVLFFRLGDFYEMFFEDAVRSSEILDITLTGRGSTEEGRIPMCGIPYHAFQGYVRTLLDANLKVAICEQVGDPKTTKGLVERKVTRIISPATYLDDERKNSNFEYLSAIAGDGKNFAIAYLELSTGDFFVREIPKDRLTSELALLSPREIILSKTLAEDETLTTFIQDQLNVSLTAYEDWIFDLEESFRYLQEGFDFASRQSVAFYDHPHAVSAAGSILYYLKDHLHNALGHIRFPQLLESNDFMVLDKQTQRSLELVLTNQGSKSTATLLHVLDQTLTSMGARTLYHWITHPLLALDEIQKRQDSVSHFVENASGLQSLRHLFKGVKDMERTLSRLNYGVANARDLINLRDFLRRIPEISDLITVFRVPFIQELVKTVQPFSDLKALIESSIVEEPPLGIKDGGIIREGYREDLEELRAIKSKGKEWLLEFQKKESERTGIKNLRIKYSGVFGYAIEISKGQLSSVPDDYIRRQTLANAERFIVPELKEWDEKISGADDKIKALEYKIFSEIRETILQQLSPLQLMAKTIGIFDALMSLATVALQRSWTCPALVDTGELSIEAGRHPVVESMLAQGQFVENDSFLDTADNQLVVLTGPNMAGKSTYIRQVAQIVLLAQIGSFVPAKSARVGLVDRIFTRIGASDNLAQGESTFMVEMVETALILQKATKRSLLILDEVGRGTSTFDGVSIAWAICEYLVQSHAKPRTLFATHYHELTQLEEHFNGIKNYNIIVKETKDGIVFLRKIKRGGSDRSYGIHVARLAGIPKTVTDRANQILDVLENENTEATQIIEGKKGKKSKVDKNQPSLFEFSNQNHPIIDEMKNLGLDGLTPLAALNKIAEWKERLEER